MKHTLYLITTVLLTISFLPYSAKAACYPTSCQKNCCRFDGTCASYFWDTNGTDCWYQSTTCKSKGCTYNCCINNKCGTEKACETAATVGVFILLICCGVVCIGGSIGGFIWRKQYHLRRRLEFSGRNHGDVYRGQQGHQAQVTVITTQQPHQMNMGQPQMQPNMGQPQMQPNMHMGMGGQQQMMGQPQMQPNMQMQQPNNMYMGGPQQMGQPMQPMTNMSGHNQQPQYPPQPMMHNQTPNPIRY